MSSKGGQQRPPPRSGGAVPKQRHSSRARGRPLHSTESPPVSSGAQPGPQQRSGSSRRDSHPRSQGAGRDREPHSATLKETHDGDSSRGSQSEDRRGGRSASRGRASEGTAGPRWRRDHSAGRGRFPQMPQPLSVVKNPMAMMSYWALGGSCKAAQDRGRPLRLVNQHGSQRGHQHLSQGRRVSTEPRESGLKLFTDRRPQSLSRSQNATCKDSVPASERHGTQMLSGKRVKSIPNLLEISCHPEDHKQRWRSEEKSNRARQSPHVICLDYESLQKILEKDSSEIVMVLAAPRSGLKELLDKEDTTDDLISIALEVLSKVCTNKTNRQNLQHLLIDVKESQFLKKILPMFVLRVSRHTDPDKRTQSLVKLDQILALLLTLISVFPASAVIDVSFITTLVESEIHHLQSTGITVLEQTENSLRSLQEIIDHLQERKREGTLRSDNYTFLMGNEAEPGVKNYRQMSIFPMYEDIHTTDKPFMRPNIIGKKFEDGNTYLDTHFRLLREDFVRPLRDGITQLLKFEGTDLRRGRFDDIRIYFNTRILSPICTPKGILHRVQFETHNLKGVNWENSKRLLFGALLCLSKDDFETMIFATVANRDMKDLVKGITTLNFTEEGRLKLCDVSQSDTFLMIETTAFFEAYRHVLKGLQEMATEELPMQKYIVDCDAEISAPKYLMGQQHSYSLQALKTDQPLVPQQCAKTPNIQKPDDSGGTCSSENKSDAAILGKHSLRGLQFNDKEEADILNFSHWPSKEELHLDDSQMKALQMALTKELAIIQGPPGTGKTFVGLKIVKALLANSHLWRSGDSCPILVVCYTNHALDQFLEGIYKIFRGRRGLVRVGGRCTSEILNDFSLNNLRKANNFKQNLPGHLRAMFAQLTDERKDKEQLIGMMAALLESSSKGVVHESVLEDYIVTLHGTTLGKAKGVSGRKQRSLMLEWLGISMLSNSLSQMEIPDLPDRASVEEDDNNERMSETRSELGGSEELEASSQEATGFDDLESTDPENLYQSEGEEAEPEDENNTEDEIDEDEVGSLPDEMSSSDKDVENAAKVMELADAIKQEDSMSDVASVTTEGDEAASDLIQVTEEADLVQAERMMEGDDVQKHIQHAQKRVARTQQELLVYIPAEQEGPEEENNEEAHDEEWQITKEMKKKLKQVVKQEIQKTEYMLEEEAAQIADLWALSYRQRWSLYRLWLHKYRCDLRVRVLEDEKQYQRIVNRIDELRNLEDESILKTASVIGMTTTCAARYRKVLQDIKPKIVIVEEAAEVLEAHIVTTLTPACEHLILIGDHQQLRPSATVYELATNFNLEVSLFERLIRMDVPFVRLDYQHRMRPEIAQLLTPHIYDKLENHMSVNLYDNIKGVTTNVFFLEHKHLEENIHEGRSHQNLHEAKFVKSLCYYFICQGYKPSQITVLTTYTGQLHCLKKQMPKTKFDGVKLCVVDRYQGEENDIIILSLVRSNLEGKVGFLKIPNRVCVALSRAKKGLFCIGNMSMLSRVPLWSKIMNVLSNNGQIGEALMLRCENHPKTITFVSDEEDFSRVPLGGCSLPCEYRLNCGHVCTRLCHPSDLEHKEFRCVKPCEKTLCEVGHRCPKRCFEKCGACQVIVTKTIPSCGHKQEVPCSVPPDQFTCHIPCDKSLPCGHPCVRECGSPCTHNCPQLVTADLDCGHQKKTQCWKKREAEEKNKRITCWVKCDAQLDCGHACSGNCTECSRGTSHIPCHLRCGERLICSHRCPGKCLTECVPCAESCETRCYHGSCNKICSAPCWPCRKKCGWGCKHCRCTRLCFEPCNRQPCLKHCSKKLRCGHRCIGMCGEPCPEKCRVCNPEEVQEVFFGKEAEPSARFVQLMDCRHMFEVTGFDAWMMQAEEDEVIQLKACPKCQTPIRRSVRYGPIVKRMLMDIETVKRKISEMCTEQTLSSLRQREGLGIHVPQIQDLLSNLKNPEIDLHSKVFYSKQIILHTKLAELKHNVQVTLPSRILQFKVKMQIDQCNEIISKGERDMTEYEREIKRISLLAEAYTISHMRNKFQTSLLLFPQHGELEEIINRLKESVMMLKEEEIKNLRIKLDSIAKMLHLHVKDKMLDETGYTVIDCTIFKQHHWRKCGRGHIYFTKEIEMQMRRCPECEAQ
ncbi:NFX1-type zinc finger-containing protein 1-like isoform X2 [Lepisosteus oculatus]|uniref:NFX1-type zinc finger-containing protein 1-like isoform X2 n=1 Tax=Lepisosteus oculatus TaxID=7918 RepID=UPI00074043A6|nr:PREDICTED: NFX1-type zinc finger-containing protein 1-like [Lepisosteus oculatus]XP_015210460.1 PREDICTED: NFX1-type zinc finger-containing protein 1-like [Lepisosteus oculatus]